MSVGTSSGTWRTPTMSVIKTLLIEDNNLSRAWARAFVALMKPGVEEIVPLQVTVRDFGDGSALELPSVRRALDDELKAQDEFLCETVAGTIFPHSMWNPALSRDRLFGRYLAALPRL